MKKYIALCLVLLFAGSVSAFSLSPKLAGTTKIAHARSDESYNLIDNFNGANGELLNGRNTEGSFFRWVSGTGTINASNEARHTEEVGAELATGNLVVGSFYIITASEVNHFFTDSAVDDYFIAGAATALNATNKVKLLTRSTINTVANLGFSQGRFWTTTGTLDDPDIVGGVILSDNTGNNEVRWALSRATSTLVVVKIVAGTPTVKIDTAIVYAADKKVCLVYDKAQGGITAFYNDAQVGTFQALTDASVINNTWSGFVSSGSGSVTAVDFKPLGYGSELVTNGGMEIDSGWADSGVVILNERSSTQAYAGTYSRHISAAAGNRGAGNTGATVVTGNLYLCSTWFYVVAGDAQLARNVATFLNFYTSVTVGTGSWEQSTVYAVAKGTGTETIKIITSSGAGEFYGDDVSIRQVQ